MRVRSPTFAAHFKVGWANMSWRSPAVEPIFEALSVCAALHPDPNVNEDNLGEDGGFADDGSFAVFTGGPDEELSAVGRVRSDFVNDNRFQPY